MPRFRFAATDRAGLFKSGVIESDDIREARETLRDRGFQVRDLNEVANEPMDLPAPRGESASVPRSSRPVRAPRSGGGFTFVLALLAFLLAAACAGYVLYRDPPWGRLGKYDLSTPEATVRTLLLMERNGDYQAMIALKTKVSRKKMDERLSTLEVQKTVEFQGKKGLFISFKSDGNLKKTVDWFEKDAESGYWTEKYVSVYDIEKTDKKLADEIRKWQSESVSSDSK